MQYKYLSNVTTLSLDPSKCTACGRCVEVCPHEVLSIDNRKAHAVRPDYCMECGACMKNCPEDAIEVRAGVGCAYALLGSGSCGPECGTAQSSKSSCCG
jgi:NAD-dependent dihydropyrimidine dehydrogenase PreA subunit